MPDLIVARQNLAPPVLTALDASSVALPVSSRGQPATRTGEESPGLHRNPPPLAFAVRPAFQAPSPAALGSHPSAARDGASVSAPAKPANRRRRPRLVALRREVGRLLNLVPMRRDNADEIRAEAEQDAALGFLESLAAGATTEEAIRAGKRAADRGRRPRGYRSRRESLAPTIPSIDTRPRALRPQCPPTGWRPMSLPPCPQALATWPDSAGSRSAARRRQRRGWGRRGPRSVGCWRGRARSRWMNLRSGACGPTRGQRRTAR